MSTTGTPFTDIVACLLDQNLYQRLGLNTNAVSSAELQIAYQNRLELLRNCKAELTVAGMLQAKALIDDAAGQLQDPKRRREYDLKLENSRKATNTNNKISQLEKECLTAHVSSTSNFEERYSLQSVIAEGERCQIYAAVDNHLGRPVVVKRIREHLLSSSQHIELFTKESEFFASCNSSNLVTILDFDSQSMSLVIERMKGNLTKRLNRSGCDADEVRNILRGGLTGLASLHDRNIIHGRVELEHLLDDDDGCIKLAVSPCRNGVSTSLSPSKRTKHVAPELLNARMFGQPSTAADVYAMGFVALELLCGESLASKVNPAIESQVEQSKGWLLWHASPTDHLPPIDKLLPDLPVDLIDLLTRMTAKQQHERFANARECLDQLNTVRYLPVANDGPLLTEAAELEGLEILGGANPHLHASYRHQHQISWQEIFANPLLLGQKPARNKALGLALSAMMLVAIFLLSLDTSPSAELGDAPKSDILSEVVVDASLEEDASEYLATDSVPEVVEPTKFVENLVPNKVKEKSKGWLVRFDVKPDGRVLSVSPVEGNSTNVFAQNVDSRWELKSGVHEVYCDDNRGHLSTVQVTLPEGSGELNYTIVLSPPPKTSLPKDDPKSVKREEQPIAYNPVFPAFEILGCSNTKKAAMQYHVIEETLALAIRANPRKPDQPYPYKIHDELTVDPRASYALALLAYQAGDYQTSKKFCLKSLSDARSLKAPFVQPVMLLSYLDFKAANYSTGLNHCADVANWLNQQADRQIDQKYRDAATTTIWWTGILVGYVQYVKADSLSSMINIDWVEQSLKRMSTQGQMEKYNLARRAVFEKFLALKSKRTQTIQVDRTHKSSDSPQPASSRTNYHPGSFSSELSPTAVGFRKEVYTDQMPYVITTINPNTASPFFLSSYVTIDIVAQADQTSSTLLKPGDSKLVQSRP